MDPQTFLNIAQTVTKLKMYPYFDIAHYTMMCLSVREDTPNQDSESDNTFSRKHPVCCWLSCMLTCFAGSILANLLLGEACLIPFKNHTDILTATAVWYLIFYSPFDIVYKLVKFLPFKLCIGTLKETQRAHKVYHGVTYTAKLFPHAYLLIVIIGTVKGAGSGILKSFDRFIRGIWVPNSNEFLQPSLYTKACLIASIIFVLEKTSVIEAPHAVIYFGVVIFFVYFKLSSLLFGIHDPFVPFENLFCAIFLGGMWDAMRRAISSSKSSDDSGKSKTEKKND
ncbi:trimeric intracellular cation channel type B-like [Octopus vulgaris]|uniref:Trimeric intracellular cation channel type B-like n=2 Tax=Octopus TaxID=6643 RepID=A0AA36B3J0_OCTVU|nr:trimeric intracellular cation channel type 1B.1 [Octopus sinensis]CAI9726718.1 trimeric intracellular cation channel type B-like [Octopus vulgaris]